MLKNRLKAKPDKNTTVTEATKKCQSSTPQFWVKTVIKQHPKTKRPKRNPLMTMK
jgi:hypothetical protein